MEIVNILSVDFFRFLIYYLYIYLSIVNHIYIYIYIYIYNKMQLYVTFSAQIITGSLSFSVASGAFRAKTFWKCEKLT